MKRSPDLSILLYMVILLTFGCIMIYSSSSPTCAVSEENNYQEAYFLYRQLVAIAIGAAAFVGCYRLDLKWLQKYDFVCYILALILVMIVLVPGIGIVINGSRRWIGAGLLRFQPAEIAKVLCIVFSAAFLARRGGKIKNTWPSLRDLFSKKKGERLKAVMAPFPTIVIAIGLVAFLIEREPDLGTAASIMFVLLFMLLSSGARKRHIFAVAIIGVVLVGAKIVPGLMNGANSEDNYRAARLVAFMDPWADSQGNGYQNCQSLIAVGSGGLLGLGLGESRQKYFYLPEKHTDFIFAIIGEELGLAGTLAVTVLFILILYRGFKIAAESSDLFMRILAVGCTTMIYLQAMLNILVVIGMIPVTGIPLPFISYGGSSVLSSMMLMGLLYNVSQYCSRYGRALEWENDSGDQPRGDSGNAAPADSLPDGEEDEAEPGDEDCDEDRDEDRDEAEEDEKGK